MTTKKIDLNQLLPTSTAIEPNYSPYQINNAVVNGIATINNVGPDGTNNFTFSSPDGAMQFIQANGGLQVKMLYVNIAQALADGSTIVANNGKLSVVGSGEGISDIVINGSTVTGSINFTGAVSYNSTTKTFSFNGGSGGGIQSINEDTAPNQLIQGDSNIGVATSDGTTTISLNTANIPTLSGANTYQQMQYFDGGIEIPSSLSFTEGDFNTNGFYNNIKYGLGLFLANNSDSLLSYSLLGDTWIQATGLPTNKTIYNYFNVGMYWIVSYTDGSNYTSTNGKVFTLYTQFTVPILTAVHVNGIYIIVTEEDYYYSYDMFDWDVCDTTALMKPFKSDTISFFNNKFISCGDVGYSVDGVTWLLNNAPDNAICQTVLNNTVYCVNGGSGKIWSSSDGINFTPEDSGESALAGIPLGIEFNGMQFVAYSSYVLLIKTSGSWQMASLFSLGLTYTSVAFIGKTWFVGTTTGLYVGNGVDFELLNNSHIVALEYNQDNGLLMVTQDVLSILQQTGTRIDENGVSVTSGNITVNGNQVVDVSDVATVNKAGIMQVGSGLSVDSNGIVSTTSGVTIYRYNNFQTINQEVMLFTVRAAQTGRVTLKFFYDNATQISPVYQVSILVTTTYSGSTGTTTGNAQGKLVGNFSLDAYNSYVNGADQTDIYLIISKIAIDTSHITWVQGVDGQQYLQFNSLSLNSFVGFDIVLEISGNLDTPYNSNFLTNYTITPATNTAKQYIVVNNADIGNGVGGNLFFEIPMKVQYTGDGTTSSSVFNFGGQQNGLSANNGFGINQADNQVGANTRMYFPPATDISNTVQIIKWLPVAGVYLAYLGGNNWATSPTGAVWTAFTTTFIPTGQIINDLCEAPNSLYTSAVCIVGRNVNRIPFIAVFNLTSPTNSTLLNVSNLTIIPAHTICNCVAYDSTSKTIMAGGAGYVYYCSNLSSSNLVVSEVNVTNISSTFRVVLAMGIIFDGTRFVLCGRGLNSTNTKAGWVIYSDPIATFVTSKKFYLNANSAASSGVNLNSIVYDSVNKQYIVAGGAYTVVNQQTIVQGVTFYTTALSTTQGFVVTSATFPSNSEIAIITKSATNLFIDFYNSAIGVYAVLLTQVGSNEYSTLPGSWNVLGTPNGVSLATNNTSLVTGGTAQSSLLRVGITLIPAVLYSLTPLTTSPTQVNLNSLFGISRIKDLSVDTSSYNGSFAYLGDLNNLIANVRQVYTVAQGGIINVGGGMGNIQPKMPLAVTQAKIVNYDLVYTGTTGRGNKLTVTTGNVFFAMCLDFSWVTSTTNCTIMMRLIFDESIFPTLTGTVTMNLDVILSSSLIPNIIPSGYKVTSSGFGAIITTGNVFPSVYGTAPFIVPTAKPTLTPTQQASALDCSPYYNLKITIVNGIIDFAVMSAGNLIM